MFSLSLIFLVSLVCTAQGSSAGDPLFDPTKHAGGESPWFPAPEQYGISAELPKGCVVDQAAYIVRHGARYPEVGSFAGWVTLHSKLQNATYTAEGPLSFLPSWQLSLDDPNNQATFLSVTGGSEAFSLGANLRKRYGFTKGGDDMIVWAASQQRVVDTASFWLSGYLSSGHYDVPSLERIVLLPDSVNFTFANSLTASAACPNYVNNVTLGSNFRAAMRPPITARLNKFLNGIALTDSDVGIMMDLCPFETEIQGTSSFCDIFTEQEWLEFEYSQDLQYFYGSGPGNNLAATTTFPLVQSITDLFNLGPGKTTANATLVPPPLLMGFTHDNDLPPVIAVLGLFNESFYAPLNPTRINPARKFRSGYITPFFGHIAMERMSCVLPASLATPALVHHVPGVTPTPLPTSQFVRIKVNEAPVPIPGCASGPGSSCPLKSFTMYIEQRGALAGDFVQRCGLSDVKNATSILNFFTNPPS
ncbi:phosphoglycerate mutase-like protein [Hysterangium stoloniferum]|nr:phosphoglycerate mutase-like protein [Hysterangium stoloniferum]